VSEPTLRVRRDGVPNRSYGRSNHVDGCQCKRCLGFQSGNVVALTHGARSLVQIQGRSADVAEGLREALRSEGIYRPAFEASIAACSIVLVRVERAAAALDAAEADAKEASDQLYARLRGWVNASTRHLSELGLTPRSLAALAKDTGLASYSRTQAAMAEPEAHLEALHDEGKA
jgi:hypothetical protein